MMRLFAFIAFMLLTVPAHATQVQEVVTPKGIRAWLVEDHSLPLVAIKLVFTEAGYAHDARGREGRANMAAALLMEGAGDLPSAQFNEALEDRAIQMNAGVDEDRLEFIMQALSEHQEKAFSYMGMALSSPRFDEDAIARIRSQSLSVLTQQEQNPGYKAYRGWQKLAFGDHGYGQPAIGTRDSLKALNADDLRHYAKRYLTRGNIIIGVSGDITPKRLGELLDAHLGELPAEFTPDTQLSDIALPAGITPQVIEHDIPQTMVRFGMQGIRRNDPDYFTAYVMNYLIGGSGLTSRLAVEIREKRGLAYSVATQLDPMRHGAGWIGQFSTRNDKAAEAVATLKATLKEFADKGITEGELTDAKRFLSGSFLLNLDSNPAIAAFLVVMQENDLGRDYFDKRESLIAAVTREGVQAMAKRIIKPENFILVMVGKPNPPPQ